MARISTEERQNMIIDEAIKIIHIGGYQSFSIRELSKQVKISEPAIYRHFLNKEDIVLGILNRIIELDNLVEKELKSKKTAKEKFKDFILVRIKFLEKNPEMTSVLFSEDIFNNSDILSKKMKIMIQKRKQLISDILEDAKYTGEIPNISTENLLSIVMGSIRMIVLEWRMSNYKFSLVKRGESILQTLDELIFNS